MRSAVISLAIILGGCFTITPPVVEKGRYSNHREMAYSMSQKLSWPGFPIDLQRELRTCVVDATYSLYTPQEIERLDRYARGEQHLTVEEFRQMDQAVNARAGGEDGVQALLRRTCPEAIARAEAFKDGVDITSSVTTRPGQDQSDSNTIARAPSSASRDNSPAGVRMNTLYCVTSDTNNFYTLWNAYQCAAGDIQLSESDWRNKQIPTIGSETAVPSETNNDLVFCYVPSNGFLYPSYTGSCGNARKVTKEMYEALERRAAESAAVESSLPTHPKSQPLPKQEAESERAASPQTSIAALSLTDPPSARVPGSAEEWPEVLEIDAFDLSGTGTAFFVSKEGHLLSNWHVVSGCDAMAVFGGDNVLRANVIATSPRLDLALLRVPVAIDRFATFSAAPPEQGADVFAIGYPLLTDFREIKITNGIISGLSGPGHDESVMQMTAAVQPGNSGGPLVNRFGQVVGVVVGKYSGDIGGGFYAEGINFAVSPAATASFLSSHKVAPKQAGHSTKLEGSEILKSVRVWTIPLLCLAQRAPS